MENVKSSKGFTLLLSVFISICSYGQQMVIERSIIYSPEYNKNVTSRVPSYGLHFTRFDDSKIAVSVYSDSLGNGVVSPVIFVKLPKSLNCKGVSLFITFSDDSKIEFRQISCSENNYCEYEIREIGYGKLRNLNFKQLYFNEIAEFNIPIDNSFFVDFFRLIM